MSNTITPQNIDNYKAPRENPLFYPGARPKFSFLLSDNIVWPIIKNNEKRFSNPLDNAVVIESTNNPNKSINEFLQVRKAAMLEDRYPVIGYGSNPVPGQLASKFGKNTTVPVLLGTLPNFEIVYNLISNQGYAFAELIVNNQDTVIDVAVTFLDQKQMETMIKTEQNYQLVYSPVSMKLEIGGSLIGGSNGQCYLFVGKKKIWVPKGCSHPISVAELNSINNNSGALAQEQTLELAIRDFSLHNSGIYSVRDLIKIIRSEANNLEKPGKIKFDIQQAIQDNPHSFQPIGKSLTNISNIESIDRGYNNNIHLSRNFKVLGTEDKHRFKVPYDFVIALNPVVSSSLKLKKYVVISRPIIENKNILTIQKKPIRAYGILVKDDLLSNDEIRMDQTLRNAIGIPFTLKKPMRYDLLIDPIKINVYQKFRNFVTKRLGRRYLFLRVSKPNPPDIEKNICRVPSDALSLMGTDIGSKIVLISPIKNKKTPSSYTLKNYSIKAFDLNKELVVHRDNEEKIHYKKKGWNARYVNASKLLGVEPDIGRIMLDLHVRNFLKVHPGDPIKVRRNFTDLFRRQIMEVGILISISSIALTRLIPDWIKTDYYLFYLLSSLSVSIIMSVSIILLRLKSRVR